MAENGLRSNQVLDCELNTNGAIPLNGDSGTLENGITWVRDSQQNNPADLGNTPFEVSSAEIIDGALGDQRFNNGRLVRYTFSGPVTMTLSSVTDGAVANPIVWTRGTNELPSINNGVWSTFSSNGQPMVYEPGAFDAQLLLNDESIAASINAGFGNFESRADSNIANNDGANRLTATQDWGTLTSAKGTVFVIRARDADAYNIAVRGPQEQELCETLNLHEDRIFDLECAPATSLAGGSPIQTLSINGNTLELTNGGSVDLTPYLDDTNLAMIVSGTVDGTTGVATFSRDDASTFTVDFSAFLADLNTQNTVSQGANITVTPTANVNGTTNYEISSADPERLILTQVNNLQETIQLTNADIDHEELVDRSGVIALGECNSITMTNSGGAFGSSPSQFGFGSESSTINMLFEFESPTDIEFAAANIAGPEAIILDTAGFELELSPNGLLDPTDNSLTNGDSTSVELIRYSQVTSIALRVVQVAQRGLLFRINSIDSITPVDVNCYVDQDGNEVVYLIQGKGKATDITSSGIPAGLLPVAQVAPSAQRVVSIATADVAAGQNVNDNDVIDTDNDVLDAGWTVVNSEYTYTGTPTHVMIHAQSNFTSGAQRIAPIMNIEKFENGNWVQKVTSASGYIRAQQGHNQSSNYLHYRDRNPGENPQYRLSSGIEAAGGAATTLAGQFDLEAVTNV